MGSAYDLNALSGINASSQGLAVISNNLANAQSVGFKSSRAEFADLFSGSPKSPGSGARVQAITQDFGQGTINGTGRDLDMAVNGTGFFVLADKTGKYNNIYSRNGSFKLDKNGFLTSQEGNEVQGYLLNEALSTEKKPKFDTTLSSINLDALNKKPKATDQMTYKINLNGQEKNNVDKNSKGVAQTNTAGNNNLTLLTNTNGVSNYSGFPDFSTNKIIYDTLGGEHRLTSNFYKRDVVTAANSTLDTNGDGIPDKYTSWMVQYTMQDKDPVTGKFVTSGHTESSTAGQATADEGMLFELRYDTNGNLVDVRRQADTNTTAPGGNSIPVGQNTANAELPAASWISAGKQPAMKWVIDTPLTGANDPLGNPKAQTVAINADLSAMSQFAGSYNLRGVTQNGFKIGDLVGLSTGLDGTINARYSNGRSVPVARLGIANFADKNAMEKLGGMTYAETYSSGAVQLGTPQNNGFGSIQAGSLEYSNVDTAGELVKMIQTQRTYQASAKVISTSQTLMQRILQL